MIQRFGGHILYLCSGLLGLGLAFYLMSPSTPTGRAQDPAADPNLIKGAPSAPAPADAQSAQPQNPNGLSQESVGQTIQTFLEPFIYQGDNRRDPFAPFQEFDPTGGAVAGPVLPLQRFDIDELKLVGVIWNVPNPKAMFTDPTNRVHILGKDDRIGRNNGYIAVIREGEVVIVETVTVRGELAYSTRVLQLPR